MDEATAAPNTAPTSSEVGTAERMLTMAAALFRERGYAAATTRELAAMLGIKGASLYYHIDRKEDLLYSLCRHALRHIHEAVEAAVSEPLPPRERVRAMIVAHVTATLRDLDKHATMLIEMRSLSDTRRAEILELRDDYDGFVRGVLEEAQAQGALRQDVPLRMLTLSLFNLLNWTIFWYRPDGSMTPDEIANLFADMFLDGATGQDLPNAAGFGA